MKNSLTKQSYRIKLKAAFTLAEVLITLAIIGVVAAMVVPTLNQNTNNQETVTRLRKMNSVLVGAYQMAKVNNPDLDSIFSGQNDDNMMNLFAPYMNFQKICYTGTGCFPNVTYKVLSGGDWVNLNITSISKGVLADGTLIFFDDQDDRSFYDIGTGPADYYAGYMYVDLNGEKGPNQQGRDIFGFQITKDAIIATGSVYYNPTRSDCNTSGVGSTCAGKVLEEGKISY